jgi:hypothetical protein
LIKGHESIYHQEPFNEVIVSRFLDGLNVDHVPYGLMLRKGEAYSICPNMLKKDEELISADDVKKIAKKEKHESFYEHYIKCCIKLGLHENIQDDLEKMITIDYLTGNTDRHWSNFGIIRNAESLKALRVAPIYDNGASFFLKFHELEIKSKNRYLECRSFKSKQSDNIKPVTDFSWVNMEVVNKLPEMIRTCFLKNRYMDYNRREAIADGIGDRIQWFKRYTGNEERKDKTMNRTRK